MSSEIISKLHLHSCYLTCHGISYIIALKQLFFLFCQTLFFYFSFLSTRQYETSLEGNLINQEMMLKRQEEEMMQLQARMALRQSRLSLYPGDTVKASMLDISRDPLREMALETAMTQRKLRVRLFSPCV